MQMNPNKDTRLCISLSGRPGNFGLRFHNHLYEQLGLNFYYKAFTSKDLKGAVTGIRALGIRGCGVSMPFKEDCIALVDELDASAQAIASINTIVNTDGHLKAYNTDYIAIAQLLRKHEVALDTTFAVLGSGGMAKAVASALRDGGYRNGLIVARNEVTGSALAKNCGYEWQAELGQYRPQMLINVTPVGMAGGAEAHDLAFSEAAIDHAEILFDVVAIPVETPLIIRGRAQGKRVITGLEVIAIQALEQFVLYTGVRPTPEQFEAAVAFARS
ncbi:shikimate 5-dehydrogenase [Pseudomonas sp. CCC3.1]|uniref:shikimate 5-dehydrogenase n=1 Tax=Pseudomonas sp. CCC3.1 TaxID=3048607 RepID=UPI002AC8D223|nr:shikimate 5-dehydrogenase [Pseudomonas sp. CCC3.1]MEB0205787.1 shikimate 5-dehydrogenase [Pseudomonas sp. CCC3.1]WPX34767.1 shikimate 5-dehydrogenase [Pseudomonas sp. CCC3.1]